MIKFNLNEFPDKETLSSYDKKFLEADIDSVKLCLSFLGTSKIVTEAYNYFFSKHELSLSKFTILMILYREENKELSPSQIAEGVDLSRGTVTGILDGLEKANFIERKHGLQDRRKVTIKLTDSGEEKLLQLLPLHFKKTSDLLNSLSKEEKELLTNILEKISKGAEVFYNKED